MEQRTAKRRKLDRGADSGSDVLNKHESSSSGGQVEDISAPKTKPAAAAARSRKQTDTVALGGTYTGETYKSSLFKLQVDDLLQQVRLRYGTKEAPAEKAMRTLKSIIEKIPARDPLSVSEAESSLRKSSNIVVPFPEPPPPRNANYKLQYAKSSYINATGSYPLKIVTKTDEQFAIDLMVTMPSAIFQEKDYLNYRYFYKRAYYLACLAAGITEDKESKFKLTFEYLNGNHLQPILVVRPSGNGGEDDFTISKCRINIIPAVAEDVFPVEKLMPHKNCVRPVTTEEASQKQKLSPTPFYNATIRSDCAIVAYLKLMHAATSQCEAYRDACILGRIWLRQRGLGSSVSGGGFGNFEWSALLAILLLARGSNGLPALSVGYSSYQLFKATLQYLSSKDMVKQPQQFQATSADLISTDGTPIFFDGPRGLNLLYKMPAWSYRSLKFEARSTVLALSDNLFDQFDSTFISKVDQSQLRFDYLARIPLSTFARQDGEANSHEHIRQEAQRLYSLLSEGLGDRATLVNINLPKEQGWNIKSKSENHAQTRALMVALLVDPNNASRTIDHGPSAEEKKAAAQFRRFWGDKAELRRFKDGSILESLVWSSNTGPVVKQIVLYLLMKNYGADNVESVTFVGDEYSTLLPSLPESGRTPFQPIMTAFTQLERDIRGLEELPLAIRHVFAADAKLRYSSIEPPLARSKFMAEPADVVIQFEGSGRWPDDLEAIQRTKIAFLLKLGELLADAVDGISTRVGLENEDRDMMNCSFLDVVYPSGTAFRIRIHHDREETLLDRRLKDKELGGPEREDAAQALAVYKRDFVRATAHTQALQTLCTRFPVLSSSIRLVKKWFASHLLANHIAPEVIELLVARTFLQPYPWRAPSSPLAGFLRTLYFLSRWDWRAQPLIVDFGASMTSAELEGIMTRFEAWRKIDSALNRVVLFAASDRDTDGTTWTDNTRPARVVAARMTALAKAACQYVKDQDLVQEPLSLFVSPLDDFDFVIHLNLQFTAAGQRKRDKASNSKFKNLQVQGLTREQMEDVGNSAVDMFVEELKQLYGHAVMLFYDNEGGDAIAGLWNPTSVAKRSWKIKLGYSVKPVVGQGDEAEVELNKDAILSEVARLGGELVQKIEVNRR